MVECSRKTVCVKKIQLTQKEATLYRKLIEKNRVPGSWTDTNLSEIMMYLFILLQRRDAIPEIRMKIFTDPEYSERQQNTAKKYFEQNGLYGSTMLQHPDFLQYLTYFISGPDLPRKFITKFCEFAEKENKYGLEVSRSFLVMLRKSIREFSLSTTQCSKDIFRLALEAGFNKEKSLIIRKTAMKVVMA
ncbi:MAG: hypothetical protein JW915_10205 [Chitinispirillaceae bacterium]|nr:hypothetical protein [Chitinispirillaceae bacterium]